MSKWPGKPKSRDFQRFADKFQNQKRVSRIAETYSAADDYIKAIKSFEESAAEFKTATFDLYVTLLTELNDMEETPLQIESIRKATAQDKIKQISDLNNEARDKLKKATDFKPIR